MAWHGRTFLRRSIKQGMELKTAELLLVNLVLVVVLMMLKTDELLIISGAGAGFDGAHELMLRRF